MVHQGSDSPTDIGATTHPQLGMPTFEPLYSTWTTVGVASVIEVIELSTPLEGDFLNEDLSVDDNISILHTKHGRIAFAPEEIAGLEYPLISVSDRLHATATLMSKQVHSERDVPPTSLGWVQQLKLHKRYLIFTTQQDCRGDDGQFVRQDVITAN